MPLKQEHDPVGVSSWREAFSASQVRWRRLSFPAMGRSEGDDRPWAASRCPTTEWTVVLQAGQGAQSALERLCSRYRTPLLAFVSRHVANPEDAEDLLQRFLAQKLSQPNFVKKLDADKGRFRTWVLCSLGNFIRDDSRRNRAGKRGNGVSPVPLDPMTGEHAPGEATADPCFAPDKALDRTWAAALQNHALSRLKAEYAQRGKEHWFDVLEPAMYDDGDALPYRAIAVEIGLTESGARSAKCRMLERMRFLIWDEVAQTVSDPALVEDELRHLMDALAG